MPSLAEITQLCRLCLVKDQVNIPIFNGQGDIQQIFHKISTCLPVKISQEDGLPKNICDGCSHKLDMFYQFWNTSSNSEKQLLQWLKEIERSLSLEKDASVQQSHSICPDDDVVLKQEAIDIDEHNADDGIPTDDLNVPTDPDYLLQQSYGSFDYQQEAYNEEAATSNAAGPSSTVTSETAAVAAPKRKRRAAAMKPLPPQINSEDEDDPDAVETKIAKTEKLSDDEDESNPEPTTFVGLPTDNEQPGPSGVDKVTGEAPWDPLNIISFPPDLPGHEMGVFDHPCACKVCNQPFTSIESLKEHIISPIWGVFVCCKCGSKFGDEKTFRLHLRDHKRLTYIGTSKSVSDASGKLIDSRVNNMFICKYCDAPFRDRGNFYNHSLTHVGETGNRMKNSATNRVINEIHSTAHFQNDPIQKIEIKKNLYDFIKYKCVVCQEGFFRADKVISHSRKCAGKSRTCDLCQRSFEDNLVLFQHYELLHKEYRKMCKFCFNTFPAESQLQQHIMKTHLKCLHFCYECKEGFASLDRFHDHMNEIHGSVFHCKDCNKEFSSLAALIHHLKTHNVKI